MQRRLGAARRRMEGRRLARLGHSDTGSGKEGPSCRCEVERPTWRFASSATVASSSEFKFSVLRVALSSKLAPVRGVGSSRGPCVVGLSDSDAS